MQQRKWLILLLWPWVPLENSLVQKKMLWEVWSRSKDHVDCRTSALEQQNTSEVTKKRPSNIAKKHNSVSHVLIHPTWEVSPHKQARKIQTTSNTNARYHPLTQVIHVESSITTVDQQNGDQVRTHSTLPRYNPGHCAQPKLRLFFSRIPNQCTLILLASHNHSDPKKYEDSKWARIRPQSMSPSLPVVDCNTLNDHQPHLTDPFFGRKEVHFKWTFLAHISISALT
jgi:hypothetical protein